MRSSDVIEKMWMGTFDVNDLSQLHPLGTLELWKHHGIWPSEFSMEIGQAVVEARTSLHDPAVARTGAPVYTTRQEEVINTVASLLKIMCVRQEERIFGWVPPENTIGTFVMYAGPNEEYNDRNRPEEFTTVEQTVRILKEGLLNTVAGLVVEDLGNVTHLKNGRLVRAIRVLGFSEP